MGKSARWPRGPFMKLPFPTWNTPVKRCSNCGVWSGVGVVFAEAAHIDALETAATVQLVEIAMRAASTGSFMVCRVLQCRSTPSLGFYRRKRRLWRCAWRTAREMATGLVSCGFDMQIPPYDVSSRRHLQQARLIPSSLTNYMSVRRSRADQGHSSTDGLTRQRIAATNALESVLRIGRVPLLTSATGKISPE